MKNNAIARSYSNIRDKNGFSLIELLISIIVASIIILAAGALSHMSLKSYYKSLSKQETYNDLSYGLKLMRGKFRNAEASAVRKNISASNIWVGKTLLEIGNTAFGIYQANNSAQREFVFLADKSNENKREVLLTAPEGDLNWTITCDPSCSGPNTITVVLTGKKKKNPFHMETTIARRNP